MEKLYLGLNVSPLSGYTTVDPVGGDGKIALDFRNLDQVAHPSECDEILADKILDYIHGSELYGVVEHWVSKLAHGGKIILGGRDVVSVAKLIVTGALNNADSNKMLYGLERSAWGVSYGMYECSEIVGILSELGLVIDKKRINGVEFIVEAHRE